MHSRWAHHLWICAEAGAGAGARAPLDFGARGHRGEPCRATIGASAAGACEQEHLEVVAHGVFHEEVGACDEVARGLPMGYSSSGAAACKHFQSEAASPRLFLGHVGLPLVASAKQQAAAFGIGEGEAAG